VDVRIYDKAGNEFAKAYPMTYDTTAPTASLSTPENEAVITDTTNQIAVKIEDTIAGVDLSTSSVELVGPNGEAINGNKSDNGVDTLIYALAAPLRENGEDDGTYLVNVTSVDKAGNSSQNQFRFFYTALAKDTISTTPTGGDYVTQLDTVSVTFSSEVDPDNFKISLLSPPDGDEVPGTTELEGTTLLYRLDGVLPTNGSADGEYTNLKHKVT